MSITGAIDPRDAQADGVWTDVALTECLGHDAMEHFLDLEFTRRLKVGAASPGFGEHTTLLVGQKTDSLRATSVDAEHMHHGTMVQCSFPCMLPSASSRVVFRASRVAICLVSILAAATREWRVEAADPSIQASWVSAATLEAPDGVRRAVSAAIAGGMTTIVAPAPLYEDSVPDRFMELLRLAHDRQLQVHASFDIDRAALADEVPAARSHVIYQHPEWLMVPRAIAPELLTIDVRSPEYVGRLARWARANAVDGIYLSPLADEAAAYVAAAAARVLRRYAVDGVQLDAVRYPARDFDYGSRSIEAFREDIRPSLAPLDRVRVDSDEAIDPFAYPSAFPDSWLRFRQERLTRLVAQVRAAIAAALPGIPVTAVVSGTAESDLENHLQDWRSWIESRLVDAVSVRSGATTTIVSDANALLKIVSAAQTSGSH